MKKLLVVNGGKGNCSCRWRWKGMYNPVLVICPFDNDFNCLVLSHSKKKKRESMLLIFQAFVLIVSLTSFSSLPVSLNFDHQFQRRPLKLNTLRPLVHLKGAIGYLNDPYIRQVRERPMIYIFFI